MTVSTQPTLATYAGAGLTGPYTIPFRFTANSDVVVQKKDGDGVTTVLSGNAITGAGNPSGGSLTTSAPVAVGETLLIYRSVPLTQPADYIAADAFPAETHEGALDRLTMIAQDQGRDVDRSFKVPIGSDLPTDTTDLVAAVAAVITDDDLIASLAAAGATQVDLITAAGGAQALVVETEGTEQTALITDEGNIQVAAVDAAGVAAAALVAAAAGAVFYADTTAGLAATTNGQFFLVQGDGTNTYCQLYKNVAGSASFITNSPSATLLLSVFANAFSRAEAEARGTALGQYFSVGIGCNGTPIDGTAVSNFTYMMEKPVPADGVITRIRAFIKNSGTSFKVKRWALTDSTAVQAAEYSVAVAPGSNDLYAGVNFAPIPVLRGERLALYGFSASGKLAVTSAAPSNQTPYRSIAGDAAGGTVSTVTSTVRIEVELTILCANGNLLTINDRANAAAGDPTRETVRFSRFADPLVSPAVVSAVSAGAAFLDPHPLPGGNLTKVEIAATAAGLTYLLFATMQPTGVKWEKVIPVMLAAGVNTLTVGAGLPSGIVLPQNCRKGVWRPSSGGATVQYAINSAIIGQVGMRGSAFHYRFTTGQPVEGATFTGTTYNAATQQLVMSVTIETQNSVRGRLSQPLLTIDEGFAAGAISPRLVATGTWTPSAGKVTSGSTGLTNSLKCVSGDLSHRRRGFCEFKLADATSRIGIFFDSFGTGGAGTIVTISAVDNTFILHKFYSGAGTVPAVHDQRTAPLAIAITAGRKYQCELKLNGRVATFTLWDAVTGESEVITVDASSAANSILFPSHIGTCAGRFGAAFITGSGEISRLRADSNIIQPRIVVIGDSQAFGQYADGTAAWANQLEAALPEGQVLISALSGSIMYEGVQRLQMILDTCSPEAVICQLGGNLDNIVNIDDSLTAWKARTDEFAATANQAGARVYMCPIGPTTRLLPPNPPGKPLTASGKGIQEEYTLYHLAKAAASPDLYRVPRFDLATSLNNDGITLDPTKYADDAHWNNGGHNAAYGRLQQDAPELLATAR